MFARAPMLALLVGVALALPADSPAAAPPAGPRLDQYGDPLPRRAIARLGTVRLRHPDSVSSVVFSRDGKTLISSDTTLSAADANDEIRFWDVSTGRSVRGLRGQTGGSAHLDLSPDGKLLASVSNGRHCVRVWDLRSGKVIRTFAASDTCTHLTAIFDQAGKKLLITGYGATELRDLETGKRVWKITPWGWSLSLSPDGKRFALVTEEMVRVHDLSTGREVWRRSRKKPDWPSGRVAFSPCETFLASAGKGGTLRLLEAATGKVIRHLFGHRTSIAALAFTPDGEILASGDDKGEIYLWHPRTGKANRRLQGHVGRVDTLAFAPDGKTFASGGTDYIVRLWDVATGQERFPWQGHRSFVESLVFSRDGRAMVSGSSDGGILQWDVRAARQKRRLAGKGEPLSVVTFSPDNRTLVSAGWDGVIREYAWDTGKVRRQLTGHRDLIYSVAFSPDGRTLASASIDSTIRLWDLAAGKERARLEGGAVWKWVTSLAFSPDGQVLVSGREDGAIHLTSLATLREVRRLPKTGHRTWVCYSPDGRFLASANERGEVRLLDPKDGRQRITWKTGNTPLRCITIAPDGRTVAVGSRAGKVHLLEAASGQEVLCFSGHTADVNCVVFAPDGRSVASGSRDFTILLWDVTGLGAGAKRAGGRLSVKQLDGLWQRLAGNQAAGAREALWQMVSSPEESVAFLRSRLRPVPPVSAKRTGQLIDDLDDDRFAVRQRASQELERLGELAGPQLRMVLEGRPSLELRTRVTRLLAQMEGKPSVTTLRHSRALEVLEQIGSAGARTLLGKLASGAEEALLTQEATAALRRLSMSPVSLP